MKKPKKDQLPQFSKMIVEFFTAHPEIKQSGLAKRAGIDRITLWRIMNGSEPTSTTKVKISDAIQYYWRIDFKGSKS